ncbi:MAG: hypothetical protein IKS10_07190 [Lachnospiraceae bacterium]|nr:hypothetical protein [Lachnospiraceae bacterium]
MGKVLFVGFKGKNNASGKLAAACSPEHLLLTNSFAGLRKDIDLAGDGYDHVILFGVDKTLTSMVRIEISDAPLNSLCNEAYWQALTKYDGRAVFIHISTTKNADEKYINKLKSVFE